jgi:hypothetical protein
MPGAQATDEADAATRAKLESRSREVISIGELVPGQATFALLMVEARLTTLRSLESVRWRFRQVM